MDSHGTTIQGRPAVPGNGGHAWLGLLLLSVVTLLQCLAAPARAEDASPELQQLLREIAVDVGLRAQSVRKDQPICPLLALAQGNDALKKQLAMDQIGVVVAQPLNNGIRFAASALGATPLVIAAYDVARCAYEHETPEGFSGCLIEAAKAFAANVAGGAAAAGNALLAALAALTTDELRKLGEELAAQHFDAKQQMVEDYQSKPDKWKANYTANGCTTYLHASWDRRKRPGATGGRISLTLQTQCDCEKSLNTNLHYKFALGARERLKSGITRVVDVPVILTPAGAGNSEPGWRAGPFGDIQLRGTCCGSDAITHCALDAKGQPTLVRPELPPDEGSGGSTDGSGTKPPGTDSAPVPLDPVSGRCPPCERDAAALASAQAGLAEAQAMLDNRRLALRQLENERYLVLARIRALVVDLATRAGDEAISSDPTSGVTVRRRDLGNGMLRITTTYPDGRVATEERPTSLGKELLPRLEEARAALRKLEAEIELVRQQIASLEGKIADLEATIERLRAAIEDCVERRCSKLLGSLELVRPLGFAWLEEGREELLIPGDSATLLRGSHGQRELAMVIEPRRDAVALMDLDLDGALDRVEASAASNALSVSFGDGSGAYRETIQVILGKTTHAVTVGDLNFDGFPDIVVASETWGDLTVVLNQGNRRFRTGPSFELERLPGSLMLTDGNGDRVPDILIGNRSGEGAVLLEGRGDGGFGPPAPSDLQIPLRFETGRLRLSDW